jgi:hypothetical protein
LKSPEGHKDTELLGDLGVDDDDDDDDDSNNIDNIIIFFTEI